MATIPVARARQIGGRNAVIAFAWMLLLAEGLILFFTTREGSSNGLRDFFRGQSDPFFLGCTIVMCGSFLLLGRMAGKQLLVNGRDPVAVVAVNTILATLASLAYVPICASVLKVRHLEGWAGVIAVFALFAACGWMVAVRKIRQSGKK